MNTESWACCRYPAEHIIGNGVCIGTESRINYALCHGGVAVVRLYLDEPHYVLMTGTEGDAIRMFDPYWLDHLPKEDIQITEDHPREYNRIVPVKYFNSDPRMSMHLDRKKNGKP